MPPSVLPVLAVVGAEGVPVFSVVEVSATVSLSDLPVSFPLSAVCPSSPGETSSSEILVFVWEESSVAT